MTIAKNAVEGHAGAMKIVSGTYGAASSSSGTVKTGLGTVISLVFQASSAATTAYPTAVPANSILQAYDGIAYACTSSEVGTWIAVGQ